MQQANYIRPAPEYAPHRREVAAIDSAPENKNLGVVAAPYQFVNLDVKVPNGTSVDLEIYFWSDLEEKFVPTSPSLGWNGLSASTSLTFDARGRRFFVMVTDFAGTDPVSINVSGYASEHPELR